LNHSQENENDWRWISATKEIGFSATASLLLLSLLAREFTLGRADPHSQGHLHQQSNPCWKKHIIATREHYRSAMKQSTWSAELRFPALQFAAFLGSLMFLISTIGLLGTINLASILSSVVLAGLFCALLRPPGDCATGMTPASAIVSAALLSAAVIASVLPPFTWDEVAYSAALPKYYAQVRHFFYRSDYGVYSSFPANYEALVTSIIILFGTPLPAKLFNAACALGMALCGCAIARCIGLKREYSTVPAALILSAPVIYASTLQIKNDISVGFFQSITLLLLVLYLRRSKIRDLLFSGAAMGIALGTKYSSLQFAACMLPCVSIAARAATGSLSSAARHVTLFAAVSAAAASPWYIRNALLFGNPLFPFFNTLFSSDNDFSVLNSEILAESFNGQSNWSWGSGSISTIPMVFAAQFGIVAALFGIIGCAFAIAPGLIRRILALFVIIYLVVIIRFGFWEPRYFASLLVVLVSFAALAIQAAADFLAQTFALRKRVKFAVPPAIVVAITAAGIYHQFRMVERELKVYLVEGSDAFYRKFVTDWDVADWLNRNTKAYERIGVGTYVQPFYYLNREFLFIHSTNQKGHFEVLQSSRDVLEAFSQQELNILCFRRHRDDGRYRLDLTPKRWAFFSSFYAAVEQLERDGNLVEIAAIRDVKVYRIIYNPLRKLPSMGTL
jgi:hypothetical protein